MGTTDTPSTSYPADQTGLTTPVDKNSTVIVDNNKRPKNQPQPNYFVFDTPTMSNTDNLNTFALSQPFPGQYVRSPPGQYQFLQPSAQQPPPPWVVSIMEDIKSIKTKVDKIDNIEKTVNSINLRLNDLDLKVKDIDKRMIDVESSATFMGKRYEDQSQELKTAKDTVKTLEKSCTSLQKTIGSLETSQATMRAKVLDGEFRSMRENLIFYGIAEPPHPHYHRGTHPARLLQPESDHPWIQIRMLTPVRS